MDYLMLRGIFTTPGATKDQVDFYVDLFKKVRETQDWKDFMAKGAFNTTFMSGDEFKSWLKEADERHKDLMSKAGFLAQAQERSLRAEILCAGDARAQGLGFLHTRCRHGSARRTT